MILPDELIKKVEIIAYKVRAGFETLWIYW